MKQSANEPERSASAWREAPRARRPRAVQHLSAAGREAGTEETGAAGDDARIWRKSAMAWKNCPCDAAERIRCAHDGGNGAEPPAATAAKGRGCVLMRGAREAANCWLRRGSRSRRGRPVLFS